LGIGEYADGIFPHFFKACQLLVVVHEVIYLLLGSRWLRQDDYLERGYLWRIGLASGLCRLIPGAYSEPVLRCGLP
jgi:hypothetical protein